MKLLYLFDSSIGDVRSYVSRLHFDFWMKMIQFHQVNIYGPKEQTLNDKILSPVEYNSKYTLDDLYSIFRPDIIIAFTYNLTHNWMPAKNKLSSIPFVIFEGDYYAVLYDTDLNWYSNMGFDLMINRSYMKKNDPLTMPKVWLPLSVNENEFNEGEKLHQRVNNVVFLGNIGKAEKLYSLRKNAIDKLSQHNLIVNREIIPAKEYPIELRKYTIGLSDAGGDLHCTLGKMFEIMASGTVLLTPWFYGQKELFGEEEFFFEYKNDLSDIIKVVKYIRENLDEAQVIVDNAVQVINRYHLDRHRILEFKNILEAFLSGEEIPRKWEDDQLCKL